MQNNYYTLVLYKEDGYNTCRQCIMERWGSDFSFDSEISESEAIDKIATAFSGKFCPYGSYTAYLISLIDEKLDKYDHATITPTEKLVYKFDQHSCYGHKQPGSYQIESYHHEDNHPIIEEDIKRIDELIRSKVKEIVKNKTANK